MHKGFTRMINLLCIYPLNILLYVQERYQEKYLMDTDSFPGNPTNLAIVELPLNICPEQISLRHKARKTLGEAQIVFNKTREILSLDHLKNWIWGSSSNETSRTTIMNFDKIISFLK